MAALGLYIVLGIAYLLFVGTSKMPYLEEKSLFARHGFLFLLAGLAVLPIYQVIHNWFIIVWFSFGVLTFCINGNARTFSIAAEVSLLIFWGLSFNHGLY